MKNTKKLLAALFMLGALASCGTTPTEQPTETPTTEQPTQEQPTQEQPIPTQQPEQQE